MELKDRLKLAMSDPKVTGKDLAKACKIKPPSVSDWLSGKTQTIEASNLLAAAKFLNVSPDWLASGVGQMRKTYSTITFPHHTAQEPAAKYEVQPSNVESIATKKQVPLISWVRAGGWGEIDDHNPDTTETVPANYSQPGRYAFALSVDGDSMTTNVGLSFPHGTTIIVDPERNAKVGDFVVAKDVSTQMATFKRLSYDGGRWYLRPQNKEYPTLEIDHPEKRVIGVVIEFYIGAKLC